MDKLIKKQQCSKPIVYKSTDKDFKVDKESRIVSGYLASFNTIDSDNDMFIKGSFTKSLQERGVNSNTARKIAFLWQHDIKMPIGHFTKLEEDEYGLYFEAYVDKTQKGDEVLTQYESGTLNQHSVGMQYIFDKMEYDENLEAWLLKEVKLFEGSVVTLGSNENTPFLGFKSEQLDNIYKSLNTETDTILKQLPYDIQIELRQLITKHISLAEAKKEPQKSALTIKQSKPNIDQIVKILKIN